MQRWEKAAVKSQTSLSLLNVVQSAIIAVAVTLIMWRATVGVVNKTMTIGDLVLVNAFMIQLYIPLNFLGVLYREIKQALADMERMFALAKEHTEVADAPGAAALDVGDGEVRFEHVDFGYEPNRQILFDVSFTIPAGHTVAVVGPSGAGKSTLSRLLFRFYDVTGGRITVNGRDIRAVRQDSVRAAIGIVPQDTVLFNDTIEYNIAYGRPGATHEEIVAAAELAQIHKFIVSTPEGYETPVGERGLKLSGGEKQRVAIARAVLKDPRLLIFDEATSALTRNREGDPGGTETDRPESHDADDRPSAVHDRRRRPDPRPRPRPDRRTGPMAHFAQNGVYARMWQPSRPNRSRRSRARTIGVVSSVSGLGALIADARAEVVADRVSRNALGRGGTPRGGVVRS
jgi:ATP-binding cassette subfamily B protein